MGNFIRTDGVKAVDLSLEVYLIKEGDYIVSYCPSLEVSSYGNNEDEAKTAFEEAFKIFIEDSQSRGIFEKILLDLGWSLVKKPKASFRPPKANINNPRAGKYQKVFKEKFSVLV